MSDKNVDKMSDRELRDELRFARSIIDILNREVLQRDKAAKCFHEHCHSTTYSANERERTIVYTCLKCRHVWSDL